MASRSRAGSGGKILRPRRVARVATPYDRPPKLTSRPENPNWVSKFIFSPTKVIASSAGKFISSVFGPDSSSSSSSYSGSESDSDTEIVEKNDGLVNSVGVDELSKENDDDSTRKRPQLATEKNENKLLIERLILQENFSWEECIRLISFIRSRVVEGPISKDAEVAGGSEARNKGLSRDVPDTLQTAVIEAKKWLKDKKSGSSPEVIKGEVGSPVDVAKSYMKERPPWASPSSTDAAERTTFSAQLFKEDIILSAGAKSIASSKKRDSPISGSWNILEEIRRVRSKATEEMLRTPSTKTDLCSSQLRSASLGKFDWSGSALEYKSTVNAFMPNESEAGLEDRTHTSTNLNNVLLHRQTVDIAQAAPAITLPSSMLEDGAPLDNPPLLTSEKEQDMEDNMITERQDGPPDGSVDIETILLSEPDVVDAAGDPNVSSQQLHEVKELGIPAADSRLSDTVCSMSKEEPVNGDTAAANGFPHPESSLHTEMNVEEREMRTHDEEQNQATSGFPTYPLGQSCELLSETSVEVPPIVNDHDGFSQDSSSMQYEELSQDVSGKHMETPKRGRKMTRYGRRGRGRGRGRG